MPKQPANGQDDHICLKPDELEAMLCRAADKGARKALSDVGLDGEYAADDIKELRSLSGRVQKMGFCWWPKA